MMPVAISSSADLSALKSLTDSSVDGNESSALENPAKVQQFTAQRWIDTLDWQLGTRFSH